MAKAKRPQQNAQRSVQQSGRQAPSRAGSAAAASGATGVARSSNQRAAQTGATGATGKARAAQSTTSTTRTNANGTVKGASEAPRRYQPLATRSNTGRNTAYGSKVATPAWLQWGRKNLPLLIAGVTVVLLVAIIVLIARGNGGPAGIGSPAPASVTQPLTNAPASLYASVGTGGLPSPFAGSSGAHIGGSNGGGGIAKGPDGKPIFFYAGAEYCPYCAAERWSMVMALSRFGTISNLTLSASTGNDVYPNTPTFTFVGSSYSSSYIDFQSVEETDRNQQLLQTPTTQQQQYLAFNNTPYIKNGNGIPFLNFANQYVTNGAGYSPGALDSLTWQNIADKIKNSPSDTVTQDVVGNANYITAAICQTTDQQPANVCKQAPIPSIESKL